jgi:uncharacterized protein (TIGR00725 family)
MIRVFLRVYELRRKFIVGVMGPGKECPEHIAAAAFELGSLIARQGGTVLSGGRDMGVMDAVSRGAKKEGGTTIGILPAQGSSISDAIDFAIVTDVNLARNNINVVTSDIVVSCGIGVGTASEIALGLNAGKHVVMLHAGDEANKFFTGLRPSLAHPVLSSREVIEVIQRFREGTL